MRILGVDTSTTTASIALIEDSRLVAEAGCSSQTEMPPALSAKGNHSETVLPLIQAVLDKAAFRLSDLSAIAISIGPGSFTGLRIGLALVKGLAYGCALPVIGVSSLEAQAARVEDSGGSICPLLDARKQEVYGALFERRSGALLRRMADRVFAVSALAAVTELQGAAAPIVLVGNGAERYRVELAQMFGGRVQIIGDACSVSVGHAVARLGLERFSDPRGVDLGTLVPFYLGSSQALGNTRVIPPNPLK